LLVLSTALAQDTGRTVRHHKVQVEDDSASLAQAEASIAQHDYTSAQSQLKVILEKSPGSYQAWFDLGFVNNALGHPGDAIAAYRKSVEANPEVFESNLNLGLLLATAGEPDAATYLRAATRLKPTAQEDEGHYRAWLSLGQVLEAGSPDDALNAFQQAAVLKPNDPEPHLSAALLCQRHNQLPQAEKEFQQVLKLDPGNSEAAAGLTNNYMRSGRFADAQAYLRQLSAASPDDAGLHLQLGRVLAAAGKNDDAIAELQAGLKLDPNNQSAQRDLAEIYYTSGRYDQAEPIYRSLLAANPKDPELRETYGQCLMKQKKFTDAQPQFAAAISLDPKRASAYGALAAAANENQNYPLVIRALDDRAKLTPDTPVSNFLRATAYDHLRDYKNAARYYHLFLDEDNGKLPDQEWQARHRLVTIEKKK
jgi:tetratricopeptide (TPR) repeat protein